MEASGRTIPGSTVAHNLQSRKREGYNSVGEKKIWFNALVEKVMITLVLDFRNISLCLGNGSRDESIQKQALNLRSKLYLAFSSEVLAFALCLQIPEIPY